MMLNRKNFVCVLAFAFLACGSIAFAADRDKRMIVLGVDGLDPNLLQQFIDEGALPNFKSMIEAGDFKPLQTTMPPLSPTAWSTFITGMDPTPGLFAFTGNESGGVFSVSASSTALAQVPEPGTLVLLGIGLLAVATYARRRRLA